ncbi:MAG: hypothetical protein IT462_14120 [Planctomycetes bacterium]|nr:hypothetical protein [Planctomycetota bacterium]
MRAMTGLAAATLLVVAGGLATAADAPAKDMKRNLTFKEIVALPAFEMTLYSVEPNVYSAWGYGNENKPTPLASCLEALEESDGVMGRVLIKEEKDRKEIADLLFKGFEQPGEPAHCYIPRHVVVVRGKENQAAAIHVCFQCSYAVNIDGTTTEAKYVSWGEPGGLQAKFDKLLKDAGVGLVAEGHGNREPVKRDEKRLQEVVTKKAREVFDNPDSIAVYHISAGHYRDWGYGRKADPLAAAIKDLEAGTQVHAKTAINRKSARSAMVSRVYDGIGSDADGALCYDPHHALVAKKGKETAVVFICFMCNYCVVVDADTKTSRYESFSDVSGLKDALNNLIAARNPGVDLPLD